MSSVDSPHPKLRRQDTILKECEEYLHDSRHLRDIANLKSTGKTRTGRMNLLKSTKKALGGKNREENYPQTEGIELDELSRRKVAGECLCCAWPSERKGSHRVKSCSRPIKLDKETSGYPKAKEYQRNLPPQDTDEEE
jgi:hypothetical protein